MLTTRASAATGTAGEGLGRPDAAAAARSGGDGSGGFLAAFVIATEASHPPSAGAPAPAQPVTAQLPTTQSPTAQPATVEGDDPEQQSVVAAASQTAPSAVRADGAIRRPAPSDVAELSAGLLGQTDIAPEPDASRPAAATGQLSSHRNDHDLRHPPRATGAGAVLLAAPIAQIVVSPVPAAPGAPTADPATATDPGSSAAVAAPGIPATGLSQGQGTRDMPPAGGSEQAPSDDSASRPSNPAPAADVAAAGNGSVSPPAAAADLVGGQVPGLPLAAAVASADAGGAPVLGLRPSAPAARGDSGAAQASVSSASTPTARSGAAASQGAPLQFPPAREAASAAAETAPGGAAVQPLGGGAVAPVSARSAIGSGHDGGFGGALSGGGAVGQGPLSATSATASAPSPQAGTAGPGSDATELAQQVAQHVVGALDSGRLEAVLRLHPPELGELNVRIQVAGHDVSAWFDSPLPQVQQALSQGMGQLQAGLANAGYNLNGAWVGGDAWTPRGRAAPLAPRPARLPGATQMEAVQGMTAPAARVGVSLYV